MQRSVIGAGAGAVIAILFMSALAHGAEENVPLNKVPKPVMDAVKSRFKHARPTAASTEEENGQRVYEVTIKPKGRNIDVTLTPDGDIVLIEREIRARALPTAVARALREKYPRAKYRIVEEIIKVENQHEKLDHYETLLVTAERQPIEVEISTQGRITHEEKKSSDKPD
jgi:Putative beta-lactamase-inhibitor-like, PepSY-like